MSDCDSFQQRTNVILGIVVIAVLYLLYVYFVRKEGYLGGGVDNQVYTSGATMRRLAQKFSSTNQGVYTTVHNAEISDEEPVSVVVFPADKVPAHLIAY